MYLKHKESTPIELQGITAYIPPTGMVWDFFTGNWVKTGVYSRSSKKSEQHWERQPLPSWYEKKRTEEEKKIIESEDKDFFIEECEDVRRDWWFKRLNGMWFMNNGVPTYITGGHWFYLNCWNMPTSTGYPFFMQSDRLEFYHRAYCLQDPICFGQMIVGPRRFGKTYKGGCFVFEEISRRKYARGGMQSKTGPDAAMIFSDHIVRQFRRMPHFFLPVFDRSQSDIPKTAIRFYKTPQKGRKKVSKIEELEDELESVVDFKTSSEYAYDGSRLNAYLGDEIFKTLECDTYKRWRVVKPCLMDPISGTIIGKGLLTSTVEEVEGQMENYEKFWRDSDPTDRNDNGQTRSGLYHYFVSAVAVMDIDIYGEVNEKKNLEFISNKLDSLKNDIFQHSEERRKFPLSIRDAFRPQAKDCHYDLQKLEDRYDLLSIIPEKFVRGIFKWNDLEDMSKGVSFVERKNGPFMLHKDIDYKANTWNQVSYMGSTPIPRNKAKYACGNDSYDHTTTVDGRKSNGANALFYKFNSLDPLKSDKFVCLYCFRPKKPSIFYDDTLKMLWFFGCQMLFEDNKQGIRTYFDGKNCSKFMVHLPDRKEPGIPATTKTHQDIVDVTEEYIEDCIDLVDYPDLITDWVKFDINKTTKFDLGMAAGYALKQADRIRPAEPKKETKLTEVTDVFRIYN